MAIVLIVTGIVILAIAFALYRKPSNSMEHVAIHEKMDDDSIVKQLQHRPKRAEAGLCVFFGLVVFTSGIIWQALVSFLWWGVGG